MPSLPLSCYCCRGHMSTKRKYPAPLVFLLAARPKFLTASAAPVLVGSALGYAVAGTFNLLLFALALISIMAIHAGANIANDYFDHTSGNDWLNRNPTHFSGGRRFIQQGLLSPRATLLVSLAAYLLGCALGLVIVAVTRSVFILAPGLAGVLGGFSYTAAPVRLGYRGVGQLFIAVLFGILPVVGSYFLQTSAFDPFVLLPAAVVGLLIFDVILINEFPDLPADAAVGKRTLVVAFGFGVAVWIYRVALAASYLVAIAAVLVYPWMLPAGALYLLTLPIAALAIRFANKADLATPGNYRANQITILLHTVGSLALTAGFVYSALLRS